MNETKRLNPKWRERLKQIGKEAFQKEEMLTLGFWKPSLKGTNFDKAKEQLEKTLDKLSSSRDELNNLLTQIKDAKDVEKIISEIRLRRIQKVKIKREEQRIEKKAQKDLRTQKDKNRRLITPPFLGRGVSGKLNYEGGDEKRRNELKLPAIKDLSDMSKLIEVKENKIAWLCYHREVSSCDHYTALVFLKEMDHLELFRLLRLI